ncbi:MAG: putative protein YdhW [Syntrophus sp. SKADARSKE-3]|nr:putative protein YdhW [Syntrophus sp. SKADARSKE-3]
MKVEENRPGQEIPELVAELIQERSEAGQLVSQDEILNFLIDKRFCMRNEEAQICHTRQMLRELIVNHPDLEEIAEGKWRCYYSSASMTRSYAGLMLQKRIGRLPLIAEAVRESSRVNQCPVAVDSFTRYPFDLSEHDIIDALAAMIQAEEYGDIAQTVTSVSGIYLYSSRHLDSDYAHVLAEWLDVGQFDNP